MSYTTLELLNPDADELEITDSDITRTFSLGDHVIEVCGGGGSGAGTINMVPLVVDEAWMTTADWVYDSEVDIDLTAAPVGAEQVGGYIIVVIDTDTYRVESYEITSTTAATYDQSFLTSRAHTEAEVESFQLQYDRLIYAAYDWVNADDMVNNVRIGTLYWAGYESGSSGPIRLNAMAREDYESLGGGGGDFQTVGPFDLLEGGGTLTGVPRHVAVSGSEGDLPGPVSVTMPSAPADPDGAWTVSYGAFDDASLDELDVVGALNLSVIPRGYTAVLTPVPGVGWFCDGLFPTATVPTGGGAVDSVNGETGVVVLDAADIAVDASGFNGNLTTSDDTVQEIAQKLDDLSVGGGAVDSVNGETGVVVLDASDVGAAATSHSHAGSDITSATVAFARLPTGTGSTQVAVGDHTHTAAAVGAVPTSRTLAGLDLSADRSADALLAALHAATAKPIVKGAAGYGTPWVPGTTGVGAIAATKGDLFLARGTPLRGTIDYVVAFPATAGTSGDTVWIVAYACGSNGLPTGTPLISQQVTTGTTATAIEQAVTAVDAPSVPVWVGVLFTGSNGSNINWQGVAAQIDPGVMRWASGTSTAIRATSQGNTPPDVTSYGVSSSPGSTTWGVNVVNAALVGVR